MQRPGRRNVRTGQRKNRNEVLSLTNARLIKEKYLEGNIYSRKKKNDGLIQRFVDSYFRLC